MVRNRLLTAGTRVDLVIEQNEQKESIEVRSSFVHDVSGDVLVLAQTIPPLDPSYVGRTINITVTAEEGDERVRYGFTATLERNEEHRLASGKVRDSLVFTLKSEPDPSNLRLFHRVQPPRDLVAGTVNGRAVTINDLARDGFAALWRQKQGVKPGDVVSVWLKTGNTVFQLEAEVRWVSAGRGRSKGLQFFGAQFLEPETKMKDELERQIRQIERKISARISRVS